MRNARKRRQPPAQRGASSRNIRNVVDDILFRFSDGGNLAAERAPPTLVVPPGCRPSTIARPRGVDAVNTDVGISHDGLSFWGVWFIIAAVTRFKRPLRRRQRHEKEAFSKKREADLRDLASRVAKAEDFGIFSHRTTAGRDMLSAAVKASAAAVQCERTRLSRDRTQRAAKLPEVVCSSPRHSRPAVEPRRRLVPPPTTPRIIRPQPPSKPGSAKPKEQRASPAASLARAWKRPKATLGEFLGSSRGDPAQPSEPAPSSAVMLPNPSSESISVSEGRVVHAAPPMLYSSPAMGSGTGETVSLAFGSVGEQSLAFGAHARSYVPVGDDEQSESGQFFDLERSAHRPLENITVAAAAPTGSGVDGEASPTAPARRAAFVPQQELALFTDRDFTGIPLPTAVAHPQLAYPPPDVSSEPALRAKPAETRDARAQFEQFRTGLKTAQRRFHSDELERLKVATARREAALPLKRRFLSFHCEHSEVSSAQDLSIQLRTFIRDSRVGWAHETEIENRIGWFYDFYQRVTDTCASERVHQVLSALQPHFESLEEELLVPGRFAALVAGMSDDDLMTQDVQFVLRHAAAAFGVNYVTFREILEKRNLVYLLRGSVA